MATSGMTRILALGQRTKTILASVLVFVVVGAVYGATTANRLTARAMITPASSDLLDVSAGDPRPERQTADQVKVLESHAIATRAAEISRRANPEEALAVDDILAGRTIVADPLTSDLIVVEFASRDAERAVLGAESIVAAYEEWVVEATSVPFEKTADAIDSSITEATARLTDLEERRATLTGPAGASLAAQKQAASDRVTSSLDGLSTATDPAARDAFLAELERSRGLLDTIRALEDSLASRTSEAVVLDDEITATSAQIADLIARREDLRVAVTMAGSSVRSTPAEIDETASRSALATVVVFAALGIVFGIGASLVAAARRQGT